MKIGVRLIGPGEEQWLLRVIASLLAVQQLFECAATAILFVGQQIGGQKLLAAEDIFVASQERPVAFHFNAHPTVAGGEDGIGQLRHTEDPTLQALGSECGAGLDARHRDT